MKLLVRNKVNDFDAWLKVFKSHAPAHRAAGFHVEKVWRNIDDQREIFFIFEVEDRTKAEEFMATPLAADGAKEAGVIDGDHYFVVEFEDS